MIPLWAWLWAVSPTADDSHWMQWHVPSGCPDAVSTQAAVERRLGRSVESSEATVNGSVVAEGPEYALTLEIFQIGEQQRYTLRSADCEALSEAASLLVAVSVDPLAPVRRSPPQPAATPQAPVLRPVAPEPEPESVEPEPVLEARSPARPSEPTESTSVGLEHVTLAAAGGGEWGALPTASWAARARLGLGWPSMRVELGATYETPRVEANDIGAARVRMAVGDLRGCWRFRRAELEAPLCGGVELGASFAQGLRDPGRRSARGWWLAGVASVGVVRWFAPRFGVLVRAEGAVAPVRTAYDVRGAGEPRKVFEPAPVSGRLWIGIEGKLWQPG